MVLPGIPFLRAGEIAGVWRDIGSAWSTLQSVQDPPPVVTVKRRNSATGAIVDVLTTQTIIGIWLDNRDEQETGINEGRASTAVVGEVMAFAPFPVEIGDWFVWDGFRCVIASVEPVTLGTVTARFQLEERVR